MEEPWYVLVCRQVKPKYKDKWPKKRPKTEKRPKTSLRKKKTEFTRVKMRTTTPTYPTSVVLWHEVWYPLPSVHFVWHPAQANGVATRWSPNTHGGRSRANRGSHTKNGVPGPSKPGFYGICPCVASSRTTCALSCDLCMMPRFG